MDRNYDIINFISKCIYLKKSRVAIFADIIKIVTIIKTVSSFIIVGYVSDFGEQYRKGSS